MRRLLVFTLLLMSNIVFGQMTEKNLREYTNRIVGTFSTEQQHLADSTFDNVRVYTKLIRKDRNGIYWVYTEQGEFVNYKPYRQRVYQLAIVDGKILQRIYYIKNESNFSYFNLKSIKSITAKDIYIKPGCDLEISHIAYPVLKDVYGGYTNDTNCVATFRGSSYTTTDFKVYKDAVHSWERGWTKTGVQVWGSSKGHYIYKKISNK